MPQVPVKINVGNISRAQNSAFLGDEVDRRIKALISKAFAEQCNDTLDSVCQ